MAQGFEIPDIERLLRVLPHRYPLLLVDRIIELSDNHAVAIKNVTFNEPFFVGHFPGRPVMPGVLILEALAQTGAVIALSGGPDEREANLLLTGADNVRFRRQVIPGDQLRLEVHLLRRHRPLWKMHAEARVGDELAAEADISAMEITGARS